MILICFVKRCIVMIAIIRIVFNNMKHICFIRANDMQLHERLKKARLDAKLSAKHVAARLKVKRVQLWRMETNADFVSVRRLKELSEIYGIPLLTLLDDKVEITNEGIPIELIGMAIKAVETVAAKQPKRPTPDLMSKAVVAVIRIHHEKWIKDASSRFDPVQYTIAIEELLKDNT